MTAAGEQQAERDYARTVCGRIAQQALADLEAFIQEDGSTPDSRVYGTRVVAAVGALCAVAGALIGATCSSAENMAEGAVRGSELVMDHAAVQMAKRIGSPIAVQRGGSRLRDLLAAAQQALLALKNTGIVMDAVPPLLHKHTDPSLARIGVFVHEQGVYRQVRNAEEALLESLAQMAFAVKGPPTTNPPAGG